MRSVSWRVRRQSEFRPALEQLETRAVPAGIAFNFALSDPDILFHINTVYLADVYFDPSGAARTGPVPDDKTDFISIALHELTHSLGITTRREVDGPGYGQFKSNFKESFDELTAFGSGS